MASRHAQAIAGRALFAGVAACCLAGRPSVAEALAALAGEPVYLVPALMADGYTARTLLKRALTETAPADRARVVVRPPAGTHAGLARLCLGAALRACAVEGWHADAARLVLAAHGTKRSARSAEAARRHAEAIAHGARFAHVSCGFLEQEPRLDAVLAELPAVPTVVVGLFADRGGHGEGDVGALVAAAPGPAHYAGPIGTDPGFAELIVARALAADA
ncbi:MAG TPA: CbiX/SirB N-terminal domain-containing protein [Alphaproteobacteria bacterium]